MCFLWESEAFEVVSVGKERSSIYSHHRAPIVIQAREINKCVNKVLCFLYMLVLFQKGGIVKNLTNNLHHEPTLGDKGKYHAGKRE